MDTVHDKLDEVVRQVEQARSMPMSSSVLLHKGDLLALLDELRGLLPQALVQAHELLGEREAVVAEGRAEAERVVAAAAEERDRMVERTEVFQRAVREAERVVDEARERAAAMQVEVDDYVDGKLANFQIVLHKTLSAVERGRAKLAGRSDLDDLGDHDDTPMPQ